MLFDPELEAMPVTAPPVPVDEREVTELEYTLYAELLVIDRPVIAPWPDILLMVLPVTMLPLAAYPRLIIVRALVPPVMLLNVLF